MSQPYHDPERQIDLDLVRCTENAALAARKWFGKGDKNKTDYVASDALRGMFSLIDCRGLVRIGEGRKDEAPGIFTGEQLGSWKEDAIQIAIALDPVDGTTLTAKGLPGAISVLAVNACANGHDDPRELFPSIECHYMDKIAYGQGVKNSGAEISLDAPLEDNLRAIAGSLEKRVTDLVAVVLDRPRHEKIITGLRQAGCGIRQISDGDVAAAIAPSLVDSGVDLYLGVGGSPEAVLSAAAIKCLGGEQLCRMWPKNDDEKQSLRETEGYTDDDFDKVWLVDEMAKGENIIFAATGISDSPMLKGIRHGRHHCVTESILMRARNGTVRWIRTMHNLSEKTIRMGSTGEEVSI